MSNNLLLILVIIGILVIYWIIWGQGKHNQKMREYELARVKIKLAKKKTKKKK